MNPDIQRIERYRRKVMASETPIIVHDGDCDFFSRHVCTCGLLHALAVMPTEAEKLYPKYWEESAQQAAMMDVIDMHRKKDEVTK